MVTVFRIPGDDLRNAFRRSFLFMALAAALLGVSSCAGPPRLQPEIDSLLVTNRWSVAADRIEEEKADYGRGNYLLYYLDRGLLEQMTGRFAESVRSFEKAKQRFEKLYTQSVSAEAASWAVNDYALPYRGSDYEYVLVNVFQAMNFVQLGQLDEAIVEARDLDSKFRVIEEAASRSKRKHFEDNGFARMFMGLLYEAAGDAQDLNDAWIAYRQALALFDGYYDKTYVPELLQERLIAAAQRFKDDDLDAFRRRFPLAARAVAERGTGRAEIVLVQLVGYSPLKASQVIPVPLDRGIVTEIALPKFVPRHYDIRGARFWADGPAGRVTVEAELGADIENVAVRDLEAQKFWILSKATLRPALKYFIERKQEENIKKRNGSGFANLFALFSSFYNLYSEQADLRSWQALPAQIRIARLSLEPGSYHLWFESLGAEGAGLGSEDLGEIKVTANETKFIFRRAAR